MLASLLTALVLAGDLPPLRLELLDGRAALADERGITRLSRASAAVERDGPGYLECGALARVELRWGGCSSVSVEGPSTFEWHAAESSAGGVFIEWLQLARARFEVRRGPLRIALPGGWLVTIERGAGCVRELAGGGLELELDAGAPLLVAHQRADGSVRPPWTLLPGAKLRLEASGGTPRIAAHSTARLLGTWSRPEASCVETRRAVPPWSGFEWPWKAEGGAALAIEVGAPPAPEPAPRPARPASTLDLPGAAPSVEIPAKEATEALPIGVQGAFTHVEAATRPD